MGKVNIVQRTLKVNIDNGKLIELGRELSRYNQEWIELESEKSSVAADYTAKIKRVKTEVEGISLKISTNSEYKNIDCRYDYNVPKKGMKTLTRLDTKKKIGEEKMSNDDVQMLLKLKKKKEKK